jgi:hypothetical protein
VGKLYGLVTGMVLVFAAAMSFATLAVYIDDWWPGLVAGGLLMGFAVAGGLIPPMLRSLEEREVRAAKALLQLFGSLCGLLLFTMALISWILGKRYIHASSGYTTLGLLIFLGFAGVGLQGALAMAGYFTYVRNETLVAPSRLDRHPELAGPHGH